MIAIDSVNDQVVGDTDSDLAAMVIRDARRQLDRGLSQRGSRRAVR